MELNLEEQGLVATYRRLNEKGKKELAGFASSLLEAAKAAAAEEPESTAGSCKISREEERPETAAEPICTE
ncbi:hypothetical protein LPW11_09250 [Geomonas sp. RF6]|uniref:hypothetical protein n=1 Tax=Geomonas sp. RF6 TaxID=2897342 RepID=UPI001E417DE8|nr:hypothetical protein [Geomonas sp. RF6]UFS72362.1 hypothetical protein LPW11_09250 [Geomonas sp. RF6]